MDHSLIIYKKFYRARINPDGYTWEPVMKVHATNRTVGWPRVDTFWKEGGFRGGETIGSQNATVEQKTVYYSTGFFQRESKVIYFPGACDWGCWGKSLDGAQLWAYRGEDIPSGSWFVPDAKNLYLSIQGLPNSRL